MLEILYKYCNKAAGLEKLPKHLRVIVEEIIAVKDAENDIERKIYMPYINSRLTLKLSEEDKETLKTQMGKIVSEIPGKSEEWLMISFDDDKTIYFRGKEMEKAAFIEVKIAGTTEREYKNKVTNLLCSLYETKLNIPKHNIFITFSEVLDWGWNGELF